MSLRIYCQLSLLIGKRMKNSRLVKISKYLSYHLRHHPEKLNLQIEPGGWVKVEEILTACRRNNFLINLQELKEVVEKNDKKRFSFNEKRTQIRANQGHSIAVDLQLKTATPPAILYHGTVKRVVKSILQQGLQKMARHHVHLSADVDTAKIVGARRGKSIIFQVNAMKMSEDGYEFYCSDNGVWLVNEVPPQYLQELESFFSDRQLN